LELITCPIDKIEKVKQLLLENDLPTDDVEDNEVQLFVIQEKGQLTGVVGVEVYDSIALLRSLAVDSNHKKLGIGKLLVEFAIQYLIKNGINEIYLLTTTAEGYFLKFGFKSVNRSKIPSAIQKTKQFESICPQTAIVMSRSIYSE
jgi:amino-acid N-acetyltransferase